MLYNISYNFYSPHDPDEEFFMLLGSLGTYQLGFDGFLLIDTPYIASGLRDELDKYFMGGKRGKYCICRMVKDSGGRFDKHTRRFISKYWSRVPEMDDLGKMPDAQQQ